MQHSSHKFLYSSYKAFFFFFFPSEHKSNERGTEVRKEHSLGFLISQEQQLTRKAAASPSLKQDNQRPDPNSLSLCGA